MKIGMRVSLFLVSLIMIAGCHTQKMNAHQQQIRISPRLPQTTPWDLAELSRPPALQWIDCNDTAWSLKYQALPYNGIEKTSVFAYYATPGTLSRNRSLDKDLPGIVLVHGGGDGTAFKEWVELWAKRGYAAIAMDHSGCTPDHKRLADGGPPREGKYVFADMNEPLTSQWPYHAVADVILAHSLLRSFAEVDANRTAITGISWGGYLTCIAAGLDNRFKAAVPVYGCGFLYENSGWNGEFKAMTPQGRSQCAQLFDPSRYVGAASMPMFFVNGTNDLSFPLDSYMKTCDLVTQRNMRITVNMEHGHQPGWNPKEIHMFIDQYLRGAAPLPLIEHETLSDDQITASVLSAEQLCDAQLNYTTDTGSLEKRVWHTVPAQLEKNRIQASLPANTAIWFLTVSDERQAIVSGQVHILR